MIDQTLAQHLRELRNLHGYTQETVSTRLHIERAAYANYESGKREPSLQTTSAIADLYGISLDLLIRGRIFSEEAPQTDGGLPADEQLLLLRYRRLSKQGKRDCLEFARFRNAT